MPKDRRRSRIAAHAQSAWPTSTRLGVLAEGSLPKPEHVNVGGLAGASVSEILASLSGKTSDPSISATVLPTQPSKKDKQKVRHQALMTHLANQSKSSPYARPSNTPTKTSKAKVPKQKVKTVKSMRNALATPMSDLTAALEEATQVQPVADDAKKKEVKVKKIKQPVPSSKTSGTLTAAQKRRILLDEQRRQPMMRDDATFSANPFEAIRAQALAAQTPT
ncbi:hypothetical protein FRB94_012441 [Tulasnella sp. JGI-2019a]|nr:hypothetical protein FRB94_012441 [Tulasnella sp. JGI-2019a]KAG9025877.1 hypothetical protein FRB95_009652 [Tulasnella sp. JGI-2019a]